MSNRKGCLRTRVMCVILCMNRSRISRPGALEPSGL